MCLRHNTHLLGSPLFSSSAFPLGLMFSACSSYCSLLDFFFLVGSHLFIFLPESELWAVWLLFCWGSHVQVVENSERDVSDPLSYLCCENSDCECKGINWLLIWSSLSLCLWCCFGLVGFLFVWSFLLIFGLYLIIKLSAFMCQTQNCAKPRGKIRSAFG